MNQSEVSNKNADYWDELCGSQLAKSLGVTDSSPESLKKFDQWYMNFYPYLYRHIPFMQLRNKRVLEIGLGYGTVSQLLVESGANYTGLDIANGPVKMVNHRLQANGLSGLAVQGSILDKTFPDGDFDAIVTIGCLHHTGNMQQSILECLRLLKPTGELHFMVYNAYSYRRWARWPKETLRYFAWDKFGIGQPQKASDVECGAYDADSKGTAAPETVFVSASHLRRMAAQWNMFLATRENIGEEAILGRIPRRLLLKTLGPFVGLDIYCSLRKLAIPRSLLRGYRLGPPFGKGG